jgi:hypothetical protein
MTEAEWLACTHPVLLLHFLEPTASHRKQRLFACACCRCIWCLLNKHSRKAVIVAEEYADGTAGEQALKRAAHAAWQAASKGPRKATADAGLGRRWISQAVAAACWNYKSMWGPMIAAFDALAEITACSEWEELGNQPVPHAVDLIHDIFGNPYRPSPVDLTWFAWDGGIASKMAQSIYDERAFDRLPILADALEEAGCTDAAILAHCRGPGPHTRGCWVVDLLLR